MASDKEFIFHARKNEEFCINGQKHDFRGWEDLKDEDGNIRGGTAVCTRCGLSAYDHSLRYGP